MKHPLRLKPLARQTLVITGATSGIGLVTARRAAARGARLVLVARDAAALSELKAGLQGQGCAVATVAADVADEAALQRVVDVAVEQFDGFDTWVNNAGVTIFGRLDETPLADQRRLFETNYWGLVHGSLLAAAHLKRRPGGGALINVGSELSDHAAPLQGAYVASKHAIKGFTDVLRLELQHAGAPVSVTLVKPAAVATPIAANAMNVMPRQARFPSPLYAPEVVADAILDAASTPRRDVYCGLVSRVGSVGTFVAPRLADRFTKTFLFDSMHTDEPLHGVKEGNLYAPCGDRLQERGASAQLILEHSPYTAAGRTPWPILLALAGVAVAGLALVGQTVRRSPGGNSR